MRKEYIQSAENGVGQTQKQGNTAANRRAAEQRADQGNKSRDTPLSGKEKGDTVFFELPICLIYLTVDVIYPECVNTL